MKFLASLVSASLTTAFVLPDAEVFDAPVPSPPRKAVDFLAGRLDHRILSDNKTIKDEIEHFFHPEYNQHDPIAFGSQIEVQDHDFSEYTIYELISNCNHTSNFTSAVKKYENVVKLLDDPDGDHTLFVPINKAFEKIPKDHKEPSPEWIEGFLNYHIGVGSYPASKILTTNTLATALDEKFLGGKPQRLRPSFGIGGVRINVYSKVIAVNIKAKNGYIHAVNHILIPPTMIGHEISFFPAYFSTLLLAYDKTDFVEWVHNVNMIGSTVFAPSNTAWTKLGVGANAFLFNTDDGKKYLKALLKYQIVANTTVYTDEVYYGDKNEKINGGDNFHIELPSLLNGKSLGVDIHSWKLFTSMVVNGNVKVGFRDGIAKNGVVQVVDSVPLPPRSQPGPPRKNAEGEIDVEDLKELLREYIESDEEVVGEL